MVQEFNEGDLVVAIGCDLDDHIYFKDRGVRPSNTPLKVTGVGASYLYFFGAPPSGGDGWYRLRFLKVDDVPNVEVEEPDLYVYPDTPVGTELIVTQDTTTKYGQLVPKGLLCTLYREAYTPCGGYRYVTSMLGQRYVIDCDHLMIKG